VQATATRTDLIWFIDNLARVHVEGEEVGGAFGLVELLGARGDMPPLHLHQREDEAFYVLDGRLSLFFEDTKLELGPGDAAVAPRGVPHVYRVESESARWLAIASPAGFERFVREAGEATGEDALPPPREHDPARLAEIAQRYGIEILGPPGALPA
jgi:mannose-6-phosphate isomerase-like protein (cupin superfamily)